MKYKIDVKRITDGNVCIQGWALPKNPYDGFKVYIFDGKNELKNITIAKTCRKDVAEICLDNYNGDAYFGFSIEFPFDENKNYELHIISGNDTAIEKINRKSIDRFNSIKYRQKELFNSYFNSNTFKRAIDFLIKEGPYEFLKKTIRKIKGLNVDYDYAEWYSLTKKSDEELNFERSNDDFKIKPFYSIVIPVYDTSDEFLMLLFKSLLNQTYNNFEICIADATIYGKNKNNPKCFFEKLLSGKINTNYYNYNLDNIKIEYLNKNSSISENTNYAISLAKGDYIILCDHDDELTVDALYEMTKAINNNLNAMLLYSDEDKIDIKSDDVFEPAFKPDFSIDMLLSVNYICHLTAIKKSLLDEIYNEDGVYERKEFNGAQDYDLYLRLVNKILNKYDESQIVHIPRVLYHWRCHKESTSKNVASKNYAFINGEKAIENFYKNTKIDFPIVEKVEKGFDFGLYHTIYKKDIEPMISIIIPNKDHIEDLDLVINSLVKGDYKNIEFIICENNSIERKTFEYYEYIKNKLHFNFNVVNYKGTFNYSKINNFAAKFANGEYLLFLNNDVEMIEKNSLFEMLSYLKRKNVGAVGAKLLYKDKTLQHAGAILGIGGVAGHAFVGLNNVEHSYMNRAHIVQNVSAVTAACLMTKKKVFDEVGGFDENIAVAFNDIDLCIKIREKGYLIVYNPYSSFFHYESKTRGYEDTKEKVDRFNRETALILKKWPHIFDKIDKYYNPNLTLRKQDFSLRNLKYEKIGEIYEVPNEIKEIISSL